jgi:hypothetical protein
VAWYFFVVQWADGRSTDVGTTVLPDHNAAHRYARLMIRELKQRPDYRDPDLKMVVKDSDGEVIHVIPL